MTDWVVVADMRDNSTEIRFQSFLLKLHFLFKDTAGSLFSYKLRSLYIIKQQASHLCGGMLNSGLQFLPIHPSSALLSNP